MDSWIGNIQRDMSQTWAMALTLMGHLGWHGQVGLEDQLVMLYDSMTIQWLNSGERL